jgi:hypothetical protein
MANSKRRCRWCKQYGSPEDGQIINGAFYCSLDHAIAYGKAKAPQAIRKAHRAQKAAYAAQDTGKLKNSTQAAVNKLCRLLDQGRPCMSCGRPDEGGKKVNAGHYKSRGSNSGLRYSLINLHQQCVVCNLHLSGNVEGYRKGLVERYGQAMLDYLDSAPRLRDWAPDELKQIAKEVRAEIKRIESGQGQSRDWRALPENNLK